MNNTPHIIEVTPENFTEEVLKSDRPVILAFLIQEGCKYCDEFKPVFEQYAIDHPEVKCVSHTQETLASKPTSIRLKYGTNSFPNGVSFKNGIKRKTNQGAGLSEAVLDDMLEFIEEISNEKLSYKKVQTSIEIARINLEVANLQGDLFNLRTLDQKLEEEAYRRATAEQNAHEQDALSQLPKTSGPIEDFILPNPTIAESEKEPCDGCQ